MLWQGWGGGQFWVGQRRKRFPTDPGQTMTQRKRAARKQRKTASAVLAEGQGRPAHVGRVLRRAREYLRLSLREVERRIGRSNAYLSQIERGVIKQPDPVVLLELADLYRLDFMTLAQWAGWT